MIYVKNVSPKPIGFGKDVILPEETKPLPEGYPVTHPTVNFYLKNDPPFLQKVSEAPPVEDDEEEVEETDPRIVAAEAMSEDELKALATELQIPFSFNISRPTLLQRVISYYKEN